MAYQFASDKPIFEQIMDYIVVKIACGIYNKEDRLPSVRDFALKLGVNPNTVQRALAELERAEIIYAKRGGGNYVADPQKAEQLRLKIASERASFFVHELSRMGFNTQQIISLTEETCIERS